MAVPISNVTRRVVYAASGTGPYAFTFEILANTDIAVYKDDTLLTLTTDYTVTIASNGTGSITLVASPTGATQIAIVGNRTIQRTTDFVTGGDFFANTVNDEMDQQTIFAQQNAEGLQRALSAPQTDPTTINMTLPRASLRANKALGFDANGNPAIADTLGTNRGNWAATTVYYVRDIVKDTTNNNIWQCITAHTSSGSQPINTNTDAAKWTLLVDAASAAAAQAAAEAAQAAAETAQAAAETAEANAETAETNAETAATAAAASETAAAASATSAAASYDAFDDRYLGAKTSNPSVDNDGNALITGAIYFNSVASEMRVWNGSAWQAQTTSPDTIAERSFSATAGQTSYTFTGGYRVGYTYVYVNGALLAAADITATDGTTITFASALSLNDEVRILSYKAIGSVAIGDISGLQTALDSKSNAANPAFTGSISEQVYALSGTALNPANGTIQTVTLAANTTLTDSLTTGKYMTLMIDDGSAYTVTWPTMTWKTDGGSAPALNTTGYTVVQLWKVSTTLYGARVGDA